MSRPPSERVLGGRYRLQREIARGGMAAVWQAEDTLLDRSVAVKLLHPQFAGDPEFIERFRREARAAARLSHPNIVPIYDVGEDSETHTPYIVMELVNGGGGNLKDRIRQSAPLPDAEIRRIGSTLAATLDYAHHKGLIHRDVKPQNVLIGDDGRTRLTDFGIAQAVTGTGLTRTGAVMGSVHYIAPEVAQGRPASPQSDIYGLGAVLYEMATGRVPFQADTDLAVALAHIQEQPAAPRTLNARLAPDLERTILRALAKSPEMRFASAAQLGEALRGGATAPIDATQRLPPASATQRMPPVSAVAARQATVAHRRAAPAAPVAPSPFARRTTRPRAPGASNATVGILVAMAAVLLALGIGFYALATLSRQGVVPPDATPAPTVAPTAPPKPVAVPSNTPVPPTATAVPPTSTAEPPTPSPAPPSPTPVPPSPTPVPPSPTPVPRTVAVPQLRGRTLDQAQSALAAAGLTVMVRGVNANVDKNVVADESPAAGTAIAPGTPVTLMVGTGNTAVPDVANQPAAQAAQTLQNNSFRVLTRQIRDNRVAPGAAVGTLPEAGTPAPRGSQVELDISSGRGG